MSYEAQKCGHITLIELGKDVEKRLDEAIKIVILCGMQALVPDCQFERLTTSIPQRLAKYAHSL